jgi:hypothetical protein
MFTAYVLTRSAYCSTRTFKRLRCAMNNSTQLDQQVDWTNRLYAHVAQLTGKDVALADLEHAFKFKWTLVAGPCGTHTDPFFSRVLENEMATSLRGLLVGVNHVCRALPGLNPAELSQDTDDATWAAVNMLYNRLGPALVSAHTSQEQLLAIVSAARDELVQSAHAKDQTRLSYQAQGIQALQAICAHVHEEGLEMLAMKLEELRDQVSFIIRYPPVAFDAELKSMGVSLTELQAYFFPAEGERMNGAIFEMSVARWAATYYEQVSTACIAALDVMRQHASKPPTWHGFASVALWHKDHDLVRTAVETGGFGAVAAFPSVTHTHLFKDQVLAATCVSQPVALRVVRVAMVAFEAVRSGLLRPRTLRGEHVLGLIYRVGCEAAVRRDKILSDEDYEQAMELDNASEGGVSVASSVPAPFPIVPVTAIAPTMAGASTIQVALHAAKHVPKSLQRDYVLIVALRECLAHVSYVQDFGYVGISHVCERLTQLPNMGEPVTPMIDGFTKASMSMTAGHILKDKVVKRLGLPEEEAVYTDMPSWVAGSKGLCFTKAGGVHLMEYLNEVVQQMQPPGGALYANAWHTSRSAKAHARRGNLGRAGRT